MVIKLKLYNKSGVFEQKAVVVNGDEITIVIDKQLNPNIDYIAKDTTTNNVFKIQNGKFEIQSKPAAYNFIIGAIKDGEVIKEWHCESLIVKELADKSIAVGEIEELTQRLIEKSREQDAKIEELKQEVELLHKLVYALIKGE